MSRDAQQVSQLVGPPLGDRSDPQTVGRTAVPNNQEGLHTLVARMRTGFRVARAAACRQLWRVQVDGYSMAPTLVPGQVLWCESYPHVDDLRIGDIVVLGTVRPSPAASEHRGIPGASQPGIRRRPDLRAPAARLEYAPDDITLEIKRLSALPRGVGSSTMAGGPPPGYCEVLGDNPEHSADSRAFGPIPLRFVVARALWIPPQQLAPKAAAE